MLGFKEIKNKLEKKNNIYLYLSFCLFIGYFLFENQPAIDALLENIWPEKQPYMPYMQFDETAYSAVSECSRATLLTDAGNVTTRNFSREELIIRDWFSTSPLKNSFGNALLALGILTDYEKSGNRENIKTLNQYIAEIIDDNGNFREELSTVNQCMIGYTLLGLYKEEKKEYLLNAINQIHTFLTNNHIKTDSGIIPYRRNRPHVLYIDTLGMICPFLARFGYEFNSKESQELAFRQLSDFYENAVDTTTGLPFHAYNEKQQVGLGLRGWTRGVGWYCIGLIDSIPYFPEHLKERHVLETQFKSLIDSAVKYQKENGCWSWEICNVDSTDDTSGSAMIAYSIVRACEMGILADTYLSISEKVLNGIMTYTTANGEIMHSLADCEGIGDYPQIYSHTTWGQGSVQALCSLLRDKMQKGRKK